MDVKDQFRFIKLFGSKTMCSPSLGSNGGLVFLGGSHGHQIADANQLSRVASVGGKIGWGKMTWKWVINVNTMNHWKHELLEGHIECVMHILQKTFSKVAITIKDAMEI